MKKFLTFLASLFLVSSLKAYSAGDPGFFYLMEDTYGTYEYLSENATSTTQNYTGALQAIVIVPPQSSGNQEIFVSMVDGYGGVWYEVDSGYMADGSKVYLMRTDAFHYYGTVQVVTWLSSSQGVWKQLYIQ